MFISCRLIGTSGRFGLFIAHQPPQCRNFPSAKQQVKGYVTARTRQSGHQQKKHRRFYHWLDTDDEQGHNGRCRQGPAGGGRQPPLAQSLQALPVEPE